MMIFPKEILEHNATHYAFKTTIKSKLIYSVVLGVFIIALVSLKYIYTSIHVTSRGLLNTANQKEIIVSPKSGYVESSSIKYNESVLVGDTLLKIDNYALLNQIDELEERLKISEEIISDLNYLLFARQPSVKHLHTSRFLQGYAEFKQKIRVIEGKIQAKKRILDRQEILFESKVISESEIEKERFEYRTLIEEKEYLKTEQRFIWDKERQNEKLKTVGLRTQLKNLHEEREEFVLIAQKPGTLLNVKEISKGKFLNAGEAIAELSEDNELVAQLYVSPSKIGLIKETDPISFQIDAYNYRNWGQAHGQIISISNDVEIIDSQPFFRITASIDEEQLALKNGAKGELKKGLTLSARIEIANRSLFDLLYDKVDDWVNPSQNIIAQNN